MDPLAAILASRNLTQQREQQNVQGPMQALSLQDMLRKRQMDEQLRGAMAESGGDPEKAMAAALRTGNVQAAHSLAPLVKMTQEAKQQQEATAGIRALNEPEATPVGGDPDSARQTRIAKLQKMQELYARNPIVSQRIAADISRLESQKPMIEHNFAVGENMVQPHISHDQGRTWQPIPGSKPSAKFAKQITNVTTGSEPVVGDFSKTGDAFLQSLPEKDRALIKKIANYDIDPKTLSTKGGQREKMLSLVTHYNQAYDDTQYANKRRAIQQFGSGPLGNQTRAINVAVEHIDTLQRAADAMKNGQFTPGNKVYNEVAKVFGQTPPNTFEALRDIVANEVVKGTIGNAGALQDRADAAAKVKASASPQQLKELMNGWTELMGGQAKGLRQQYEGSTGLKDFDTRYLRPRTIDAIVVAESKAAAAPAAGGGLEEGRKEKSKSGRPMIVRGGKWVYE